MRRIIVSLLFIFSWQSPAFSFCGFYVAKADTQIFNQASQVVLVRHEDKTVMTMANDFKGEPEEFAVVIPVPTFIEKGQIHIGNMKDIKHLDAYTAPRLVEYFDENPCRPKVVYENEVLSAAPRFKSAAVPQRSRGYGVKVEAAYTVGEYDIVILSAEESHGLEAWLIDNDYNIPHGAAAVLESYIKQNMRFFVAKVNISEQKKLGFNYLRPIQVAYASEKFMLPIRLGTVNAEGPQELFVYVLSQTGRVETTNYRTVKLPSNVELPVYIKEEFADFYRAMFAKQVKRKNMRTVFLEYAWDMNWCDPCAADPLSVKQLKDLGVFWLEGDENRDSWRHNARDVFVTRLHLRYTADKFPEDLMLQQTADRQNFQGRYILRHPWTGEADCEAAREYRQQLAKRLRQEAKQLANLTGWDIDKIRDKIDYPEASQPREDNWWQRIWEE